ncbi:unnamed protein product, partial [Owenia fusiformis]
GALQCGTTAVANQRLVLNTEPLQSKAKWIETSLSDTSSPVVFLDTSQIDAHDSVDEQGLVKNEAEVEIVCEITDTLIQCGAKPEDIGVIAPYRNQVKLIKEKFIRHGANIGLGSHNGIGHGINNGTASVEVNTVDQYQGRDKEIIIVSFVRSSNDPNTPVGELLKDSRRLNVAITRAKCKLILLGNKSTLVSYEPIKTILDALIPEQVVQLTR